MASKKFHCNLDGVIIAMQLSRQCENGLLRLHHYQPEEGSFNVDYNVLPSYGWCPMCCKFAPKSIRVVIQAKRKTEPCGLMPIRILIHKPWQWSSTTVITNLNHLGTLGIITEKSLVQYKLGLLPELLESIARDIVRDNFKPLHLLHK